MGIDFKARSLLRAKFVDGALIGFDQIKLVQGNSLTRIRVPKSSDRCVAVILPGFASSPLAVIEVIAYQEALPYCEPRAGVLKLVIT